MLRRLFTLLSALSLLLCVATVVMWVRSYWRWDHCNQQSILTDQWVGWMVESACGSLTVGHRQVDEMPDEARRWAGFSWPAELWQVYERSRTYRSFGLGFSLSDQTGVDLEGSVRLAQRQHATRVHFLPMREWRFTFPFWPLAGLSALPSAWLLKMWRQRSRRAAGGLCRSCGYDLRATPGRCPECGTSIAGKEA